MTAAVSMKEVASKAHVSVMTVSRALKNNPRVALATRERILEATKDLGYRPNPMVTALMRSRRKRCSMPRSAVLGFITAFESRHGWRRSPLNLEFFNGAFAAAEQHGYHLEEFWIREPTVSPERLCQILRTRNIPGLLIAPMPVPDDRLQFDWDNFAVVALGHSLAFPAFNRALDQQFHSMRLAFERIHNSGY